jgi:hypothetical protein
LGNKLVGQYIGSVRNGKGQNNVADASFQISDDSTFGSIIEAIGKPEAFRK